MTPSSTDHTGSPIAQLRRWADSGEPIVLSLLKVVVELGIYLFGVTIATHFSPWLRSNEGDALRRRLVEIETLAWLVLAVLAVKYTRADGSIASLAWLAVAGIRVIGTMSFALRYVVTRNPVVDAHRAATLLLIDAATVALCFAAFFRALPPKAWVGPAPTNGWQFVYTSWTTMLTMGSGFSPKDVAAGSLVMSELGCGLLLIAVTLGTVLQAIEFKKPGDAR